MMSVSVMQNTVTTKLLLLLSSPYLHPFMWRFQGFWNFFCVVNIPSTIRWIFQFLRRSPSPLVSHQFSHKHSYSSRLVMNQRLASIKLQEVLLPLCDVLGSPSQLCASKEITQSIVFESTNKYVRARIWSKLTNTLWKSHIQLCQWQYSNISNT
jgi:hypothetical protein